jgi:Zn-finger protein
VKDCTGCNLPHRKENYEWMMEKCSELVEMCRRPELGTGE